MEGFRVRIGSRNGELGILVDEALGTLLECIDGFIVPPIGIISGLVIMSSS